MTRRVYPYLILLYVVFCAFAYCYAEAIITKDGRTIEGKIIETTRNKIWYEVHGKRIGIPRDDVIEVKSDDEKSEGTRQKIRYYVRTKYKWYYTDSYQSEGDNIVFYRGGTKQTIPKKDIKFINEETKDGRRIRRIMFTEMEPWVEENLEKLKSDNPKEREKAAYKLGRSEDPRVFEFLLAALSDKDVRVQYAATAGLGSLKDERAVEPLINKLTHENERVRRDAASSLGKLADPRAIRPLINLLNDEKRSVRYCALASLGKIRDGAVLEGILIAANDSDNGIRKKATELLSKIKKDDAAVDALIKALKYKDDSVRGQVAAELGKLQARRAVKPLIELLKDKSAEVKRRAIKALAGIKNVEAAEPLIVALNDGSNSIYIRGEAALALGMIGDKKSIKPLINAMADSEPYVQDFICQALVDISGQDFGEDPAAWSKWYTQRYVKKEMGQVDRQDENVKIDMEQVDQRADPEKTAITPSSEIKGQGAQISSPGSDQALSSIAGQSQAEGPVAQDMVNQQHNVKTDIREVSREIKIADEVEPTTELKVKELIAQLQSQDPEMKADAAYELGMIAMRDGPDAIVAAEETLVAALSDKSPGVQKFAKWALRFLEPTPEPGAEASAKSKIELYNSIKGLGRKEDPGATELLLKALESDDYGIKRRALDELEIRCKYLWLGKIDSRIVRPLIRRLRDEDANIRKQAAELLGYSKDTRAVSSLVATLADEDRMVVDRAAIALTNIGEPALEPLFNALKDSDWVMRARAARVLRFMRDSRAVDALTPLLNDQNEAVREAAASSIDTLRLNIRTQGDMKIKREQDPEAVNELYKKLQSDNVKVRKQAVTELGLLNYPAARDLLITALKDEDPSVRMKATSELQKRYDHKVKEAFIALLKDEDSDIRLKAAAALGERKEPEGIDALIYILQNDENEWKRFSAADFLRRAYTPRALKALVPALKDKSGYVRDNVAIMLKHNIKSPALVEPLIGALKENDRFVREIAIEALKNITGQDFQLDIAKWMLWWQENKDKLIEADD